MSFSKCYLKVDVLITVFLFAAGQVDIGVAGWSKETL